MTSSDFTYGDASEVSDRLMYGDVELTDLVGALANAMRRIACLEKRLDEVGRAADSAANIASCLANGIKPD
jgi:hypothetical protein